LTSTLAYTKGKKSQNREEEEDDTDEVVPDHVGFLNGRGEDGEEDTVSNISNAENQVAIVKNNQREIKRRIPREYLAGDYI
jgi:hypothetical protein